MTEDCTPAVPRGMRIDAIDYAPTSSSRSTGFVRLCLRSAELNLTKTTTVLEKPTRDSDRAPVPRRELCEIELEREPWRCELFRNLDDHARTRRLINVHAVGRPNAVRGCAYSKTRVIR